MAGVKGRSGVYPRTEKHKQKIRDGHADMSGENNPMFGKSRPDMIDDKNPMRNPIIAEKLGNTIRGKNHHRWIEDRSLLAYHDNFTGEFKDYIRQRDKVCQLCGRTKEEEGAKLSVHHINHDPMNDCSDEYDFILLCRGCNVKVDSNSDLYRDYFIYKITHGIMLRREPANALS